MMYYFLCDDADDADKDDEDDNDKIFRNDIDTIGVASGCTFTGFTGSSFDGDQMVVTAGIADK